MSHTAFAININVVLMDCGTLNWFRRTYAERFHRRAIHLRWILTMAI